MFTSANWLISLSRTHIIVSDTLSLLALYDHIKPQNNEPLYSNTVIGTLAVDGWAVTFGTARMGLDRLRLRLCLVPPRCTKCNNPPVNGQCTNFIIGVALY